MSVYRTNRWPECPKDHARLLNRGCPPNLSNQRVCQDCGRTFYPPKHLGDMLTSSDDGPMIQVTDRYEK